MHAVLRQRDDLRHVAGALTRQVAASLPVKGALRLYRWLAPLGRVSQPVRRLAVEGLGLEDRALVHWQRRAWWGSAASRDIKDRLAVGRDAGLDRMLLPIDWSPLETALALGRGAIAVGGHFGPGNVVPWAIARRFPDALCLLAVGRAMPPRFRVHDLGVPDSRATALMAARAVLRRGGVVYVSADGKLGGACSERNLLGLRVRVGAGAPLLGRLCGAPAVPACALWEGTRIRVELAPSIQPGVEDPTAWQDAWLEAYYRWIDGHLRGPAENLQIDGGGWR